TAHLVERARQRARVAEDRHRAGIADENDVDAGGLRHLRARVVVRRDHHDRLAERLLLRELRERYRRALGGRRRCLSRTGAHDNSSATASSTVTIRFSSFTCTTSGWYDSISVSSYWP